MTIIAFAACINVLTLIRSAVSSLVEYLHACPNQSQRAPTRNLDQQGHGRKHKQSSKV
ncbi:MAG: hypothetical protein F6K55_18605 [Moorea sp. SIO4A3]|nr:hypothetical protein [Moorena sp. SIO4A3]